VCSITGKPDGTIRTSESTFLTLVSYGRNGHVRVQRACTCVHIPVGTATFKKFSRQRVRIQLAFADPWSIKLGPSSNRAAEGRASSSGARTLSASGICSMARSGTGARGWRAGMASAAAARAPVGSAVAVVPE
jgi:hypothetical protein